MCLNLNLNDWFRIMLPIVISLGIGVTTIVMTKRNVKKQIQTNKLEEIQEIFEYLQAYYTFLYFRAKDVANYANTTNKGDTVIKILHEKNIKIIDEFNNFIGKGVIFLKTTRLKVLANLYLKNDTKLSTKLCVLSYVKLYKTIYTVVCEYNDELRLVEFKEGFPQPSDVEELVFKIQTAIQEQMELGYKPIGESEVKKFTSDKFKKHLHIG